MSALSFLGLARRAGKVEYGEESSAMAARAGKARLILVASDAGHTSRVRAENAASTGKCPAAVLPCTREELGAAIGRETVGVAAVTDISFAAAFMEKLSAEAPGYEDITSQLSARREKARQRDAEARRHQKNIKRGKK